MSVLGRDHNNYISHNRMAGIDHHLDRFVLVHRAIAVGNAVEIRDAVECATWLSLPKATIAAAETGSPC